MSTHFQKMSEYRQEGKIRHRLHDVFMSGFAMMFFQDPSILQFQKRLEEGIHNNNLRTLFQVTSIPKDSQMKDVIDDVESRELEPLFEDFFHALQRGKHLEPYRFLGDYYLVSPDGSGYFSSDTISCPGCLVKKDKGGRKDMSTRYSRRRLCVLTKNR